MIANAIRLSVMNLCLLLRFPIFIVSIRLAPLSRYFYLQYKTAGGSSTCTFPSKSITVQVGPPQSIT